MTIELLDKKFENYFIGRIKKVYEFYCNNKKLAQMVRQLSWMHYSNLIMIKNINGVNK